MVGRRPALGDPGRSSSVLGHALAGGRTGDPGGRSSARHGARRPSSPADLAPALRHARRAIPVALAALTALLGATLLPFWPPALIAALVVAAGVAAWFDPRLGLALALAAPVFPLGNYAASAAVAYVVLALAVVVVTWRDARHGLLFACGPLLGGLGLLALVPLVVQPARGVARRAIQAGLAVLAAVFVAGVESGEVSVASGQRIGLGIGPSDGVRDTLLAAWSSLAVRPGVLVAVVASAAAAGLLHWARRRSPFGIPVVGFVMTAGAVFAGAGALATATVLAGWSVAAVLAALPRTSR